MPAALRAFVARGGEIAFEVVAALRAEVQAPLVAPAKTKVCGNDKENQRRNDADKDRRDGFVLGPDSGIGRCGWSNHRAIGCDHGRGGARDGNDGPRTSVAFEMPFAKRGVK